MKAHHNIGICMTGVALEETIVTYSTTKIDGKIVPVEVTDSLRVLGAPIGSIKYYQFFILNARLRAELDAKRLLQNLDDLQTTLCIFSKCTAQKVTHTYSHTTFTTPNQTLSQTTSGYRLASSQQDLVYHEQTQPTRLFTTYFQHFC
jgi:hypothetical protein